MTDWASTKKNSQSIYVILGEYGTGKTFSSRVFASKINKAHKNDKANPYCIYIDLRDVKNYGRNPYAKAHSIFKKYNR